VLADHLEIVVSALASEISRGSVGARVIDACWLAPASIASIRRAVVNESTPGRMMPAALPSSMMRAALSVRRLRERVAHQAAAV
jgi:hypothetical protein